MQKDVIYIDVEDDITAIIGKVKAADHKIVALVPPKRIGAIQSAVNLKLVQRAADTAGKRLVIISNNAALIALAASTSIPVAKNLQSKPELAEIPALEIDEGEDVIDGAELPVGDHAKMAEDATNDAAAPAMGATAVASAVKSRADIAGMAAKSRVNVPNFDTFRKKLFLGGVAGVGLIALLVWALVFAPLATIVITARTTDAALNSKVSVGPALTSDLKAGTIKAVTKTLKSELSIPFTATGKKDVGEKATGTIKLSKLSPTDTSVPAGTQFQSTSGMVYTSNAAAVIPASQPCFPSFCAQSTSVGVTAVEGGTKYNGATGSASNSAGVSATFVGSTSGGTDKTITVVSQEDVDKAAEDVNKTEDGNTAKKELTSQFGTEYTILDSSFKSDASGVAPQPAVGAESTDGKAVLTGDVTYSLTALPKSEVNKYLDAYFKQQLDGKRDQKVYSNGLADVSFTNISPIEQGFTATISTNGKIGPKIDEVSLKEFAKGKKYGEIQTHVQQTNGVQDVDIKFSPFWVTKAPNDINKIKVEFKVNGAK